MLKKMGTSAQLQKPPDLGELHQLMSQALERRSQYVNTWWRAPDKVRQFKLEVICHAKGGDPQWSLYFEQQKSSEPLFDYSSCDVLMVYNLILSTCANVLQARRSQIRLGVLNKETIEATSRKPTGTYIPGPNDNKDAATSHGTGAVLMNGTLSNLSISELLHQITMSKMTGRLEVRNREMSAMVYVQNGNPIDATAGDTVGDEAMIELLTWKEGEFSFESRILRDSHTVHQTIEVLLAQSKQLADRTAYLKEAGLLPTSTLKLKDKNMTELDFVQKVARLAPTDVGVMTKVFRNLSGKESIDEITRALQVSRIQMVHIVYNLLINDLAVVSNEVQRSKTLALEPRVIDTAAIQSVMMSLRRAETGMFLYPAFLYFLEQEFFRSYRSRTALSVVVFEMRQAITHNGQVKKHDLSTGSVVDAALRISQLKRHVDLIAHYDNGDYALLLPNTKAAGCQIFINRIIKTLTASPLSELEEGALALAFGAASIPEDFVELSAILGAADLSMNQAKQRHVPLVMYRDIKHLTQT